MEHKNYFIVDDFEVASYSNENQAINMAIDEMLFDLLIENNEEKIKKIGLIFRVYNWKKEFYSYGYAQRILKKQNILNDYSNAMVRRPTGGGIVFHGNDICFSIMADTNIFLNLKDLESSYELIHSIILKSLLVFQGSSSLSLKKNYSIIEKNYFCFSNPVQSDILNGVKKIVGSAQKRYKNYLLHQGSIDINQLFSVFDKSNVLKILSIEMKKEFTQNLQNSLIFTDYIYNKNNLLTAKFLLETKYSREDWNKKF